MPMCGLLHDAFSAASAPCWARLPSVAATATAAVTTATPAASSRAIPALDLIHALLLLTVSQFDATKSSFVVHIRPGRGIPGGMEDPEHTHIGVAGVFQTVHHVRRQVDAGARPHRDHVVADVVRALTLDHVHHLVVGVAVQRRLARRDHAHELRDVEAAGVLVHEVAELPVRRGGERRLVRVADRDAAVLADAAVALRCRDRDGEELVRAGVLDRVTLTGDDERAGLRRELVRLALEVERAAAGDDEEDLLPAGVRTLDRAARREADHALLEVLAAAGGVDYRPDVGSIAGLPASLDLLLVDDEAVCDRQVVNSRTPVRIE